MIFALGAKLCAISISSDSSTSQPPVGSAAGLLVVVVAMPFAVVAYTTSKFADVMAGSPNCALNTPRSCAAVGSS